MKQWAAETRTLEVRMVAAHMKYASPELCLRNSEASQGKLPSSGCEAPALSSSVQTIRPLLALCCGLKRVVNNKIYVRGDMMGDTIFTAISEGQNKSFSVCI